MSFLSGASENGEGSAALPLTRRPDRLMSPRVANLVWVAAAAAVVAFVAARIVFPPTSVPATAAPVISGASAPEEVYASAASTPSASPSVPPVAEAPGPSARREYAVALPDLRGLPLDVAPGTPLELWVSWDDAYTEGPQIQRLVRSVTVVRYIEPVTAEGPLVVVLSVPEKSMKAVMYGDRFGSFSVALPVT